MIAAVSMCKDELDVIEASIERMLGLVDLVIVADNGSTDGTREVLDDLTKRHDHLEVHDDREVGYFQSRKMSALAELASTAGAEWVIPFDADEAWYSPFGRIGDVLAERPEAIAPAALYDHVATGEDLTEGTHIERFGWRRQKPARLPKVACRPRPAVTIHQGNHGADYGGTAEGLLVIRHFPYRSAEQMIRKARNGAAAAAAAELLPDNCAHWQQYGRLTDEQLTEAFNEHFFHAEPEADATLIFDPCPA